MNSNDIESNESNVSTYSDITRLIRELYVSRFKTHITTSHIQQYLKNNGIQIDHNIVITPLINPKRDLKMLSFISFKIDTTDNIAEVITSENFWPRGCLIKDFIHRQS